MSLRTIADWTAIDQRIGELQADLAAFQAEVAVAHETCASAERMWSEAASRADALRIAAKRANERAAAIETAQHRSTNREKGLEGELRPEVRALRWRWFWRRMFKKVFR